REERNLKPYGLFGEERALAFEPLGDQLVDSAVCLEGSDGVVNLGLEFGVFLAQTRANAAADQHVFAHELDCAASRSYDRLKIGAVSQDGVDIASHQVGHILVGGGEADDRVAGSEVFLGIGRLD